MSRARSVLHAAAWWAVALAALLWWSPAIMLALARFPLGRVRFVLVLALARALLEVGAVEAARRVYRAEQTRARRRMAEIKARRGW